MRFQAFCVGFCFLNTAFCFADDLPGYERLAVRRYQSGLESMLGKAERDFQRLQESLVRKQESAKNKGDLKTVQAINLELTVLSQQLQQLRGVLSGGDVEGVVANPDEKQVAVELNAFKPLGDMKGKIRTVQTQVRANQESGTLLGLPVRVGDVISIRYLSGQWSNSGLGTASPDSTGEPQLRLAIAGWSQKNNLHNSQIVTVPNGTAETPFLYKFTDAFDRVALRIGDVWGVYSDNQGVVMYEVGLIQN